ncbi:MAG: hypothetical protein ACI8RZ_004394, partial [Myxococcota bacterium]
SRGGWAGTKQQGWVGWHETAGVGGLARNSRGGWAGTKGDE